MGGDLEIFKLKYSKELQNQRDDLITLMSEIESDPNKVTILRVVKEIVAVYGQVISRLDNIIEENATLSFLLKEKLIKNSDIIEMALSGDIQHDCYEILQNIYVIDNFMLEIINKNILSEFKDISQNKIKELIQKKEELEQKLEEVELIGQDLKNKRVHEIFEDDSRKFRWIARIYEVAFYSIVIILILYFLGLTFYVNHLNFIFIDADFPKKIHGNLSTEFYIQKISLLILSTTLAAFLLKRSFMNRRLADDAYRTAKELDALPRYMEGMPHEMKEKIRFDLAYKYFGNGIHHESYTGGENLMHENIKANTDFIKAVKDLTPKVEVPKAENNQKGVA